MMLHVLARRIAALGLLAVSVCGSALGQEAGAKWHCLPDAETALQVGLHILTAKYGEQLVAKSQPYKAVAAGDRWLIVPNSPPGMRGGGKPELALSIENAEILSIGLSR
jgi:hypothetical protein